QGRTQSSIYLLPVGSKSPPSSVATHALSRSLGLSALLDKRRTGPICDQAALRWALLPVLWERTQATAGQDDARPRSDPRSLRPSARERVQELRREWLQREWRSEGSTRGWGSKASAARQQERRWRCC